MSDVRNWPPEAEDEAAAWNLEEPPDAKPTWETLPACEFGVPEDSEEGNAPCGEPATRRVSWDGTSWLHLCDQHAPEVEAADG